MVGMNERVGLIDDFYFAALVGYKTTTGWHAMLYNYYDICTDNL